jgi:hypothetical protein
LGKFSVSLKLFPNRFLKLQALIIDWDFQNGRVGSLTDSLPGKAIIALVRKKYFKKQ